MEDEQRARFRLGVILVIFVITSGAALFLFGKSNGLLADKVVIATDFRTITGLRVGSSVQLAGVEVGHVTAIDFVKVQYQCDPLTEDVGRYGRGRTDNCDDFSFCSPLGLCADLESYAAGHHPRCITSTDECAPDEVCVTHEFRQRNPRVEWRGPLGVCARFDIQHWRTRVKMKVLEEELQSIRVDSRAEIASNSLLGDQLVNIKIGIGDPLSGDYRIQAAPSVYEDIERFRRRLESVTEKADLSLTAIQGVLAGLNDEQTIASLKGIITHLEVLTYKLAKGDGLLGALINSPDYKRDVQAFFTALRGTGEGLSDTTNVANDILETVDRNMGPVMTDARIALLGVDQLLRDLRDPNNRSLMARLLIDYEGDLGPNLEQILHNTQRVTGSVSNVASAVEEGRGTIGRIINDRMLLDDISLLLRNIASHGVIRSLTIVLLRRYGIDVKAARDPAGVKR